MENDWLNELAQSFSINSTQLQAIAQTLSQHKDELPVPVETLSQVYEGLLEKSGTQKVGGAYYTPIPIVDCMLQDTVGRVLKKQPHLKILDPACGAGIFLIRAYQCLLDWQLHHYLTQRNDLTRKASSDDLVWRNSQGSWQLTFAERQRILLSYIYGVDIDAQAVEITKLSLLLKLLEGRAPSRLEPSQISLPDLSHNIQCGNALIGSDFYDEPLPKTSNPLLQQLHPVRPFDWQTAFSEVMHTGGFDVVIGNPPYIDSEWMTTFLPGWRSYCTSHYRTATGNWDLFCVFIEKAMELCQPGGLTSLIVPNKLASASYAATARSILAQENCLLSLQDYSRTPVFAVAVYPLVYISQKSPPQLEKTISYEQRRLVDQKVVCDRTYSLPYSQYWSDPQHPWLISSSSVFNLCDRLRKTFPPLSTTAQICGAATVAEAYEIQPLIQEGGDLARGDLRVVNSGTIDPYRMLWGEKRLRYLGNSYLRPIISADSIQHLPQKRQQQAQQAKLIIAGMTKKLEGVVDLSGTILAGKSTSIILSQTDLHYLLGLLNSKLLSFYFINVFGGNSLSGGYLRVGPPQLQHLPIRAIANTDLSPDALDQKRGDRIIDLVKQMLLLSDRLATAQHEQQSLQQQIHTTDQEINSLVYKLYRLTPTEIEMVEQHKR